MYSFSKYNIVVKYKNRFVICNLISTDILIVTSSIYNQIKRGDISNLEIKDKLVAGCFVNNEDECSLLMKMRLEAIASVDDQLSVVVLPTTLCNANCPYCYQHSQNSKICYTNMDTAVADLLVEYIVHNSNNNEALIWWFGGEPLLKTDIMEYISAKLKENNVQFSAYLITNGYLIDEKIDSISNVCNVKTVQITVDSIGEKYNQIKKFACSNAFDKIISNIGKLLDKKIYVKIRINFHVDEIDLALETIEFLHNYFGDNKYLKISFSHIIGDGERNILSIEPNPYVALYKKLFEYNYITALKDLQIKNKNVECMVYSNKNIVVDPEGYMYKCEHLIPHGCEKAFSKLGMDCIKSEEYDYWMDPAYSSKKCMDCKWLPICAGGCKYKAKYTGELSQCLAIKNCINDLLILYIIDLEKKKRIDLTQSTQYIKQ